MVTVAYLLRDSASDVANAKSNAVEIQVMVRGARIAEVLDQHQIHAHFSESAKQCP